MQFAEKRSQICKPLSGDIMVPAAYPVKWKKWLPGNLGVYKIPGRKIDNQRIKAFMD